MKRPLRTAALASIVALSASACAPSPVVVDLNFPNTDAFMRSQQARIRVFSLAEDQLGLCPALLEGLPTESFPLEPVFDSQLTSVCAIRSGLELPELGEGPHAYLVEALSSTRRILQGCTVAEVYEGAPNVVIALHPTADFAHATAQAGTPESRCQGGGS